jgi:FtsP/CotA-like multicopper oxidase with cupredoxin domain
VSKDRLRLVLACVATLAIVLPLAYLWWTSRLPSTYSVMDMGYDDYGGGSHSMAGHHGMSMNVKDLVDDPTRKADKVVDLTAKKGKVTLADGQKVDGYTVNGTSPGPLIEVTQGQLLEVHLHNENISEGITLHWHGVDVPNAEDGVAGVTQDAVMPGQDYTYRFVARQVGTFWYHSHQISHEQVIQGLLGPLVVRPRNVDQRVKDVVAVSHTYDGIGSLNGLKQVPVKAEPGQRVRLRLVNTDNGPTKVWSSAPYKVVATDGHEVNKPTDITDQAAILTAGGRLDVEVVAPEDGSDVRVQVGAATDLVVGGGNARVKAPSPPTRTVDFLSYGSPAPLGFDPSKADRHFQYSIGRRPGFVDGKPGLWWTINGHLWPNIPMFVVNEGDIVKVRISNHSGDVHPMHLHGHRVVVLSRDGVRATGSPWVVDSLNVENDETYDVAFVADNPGVWMDHCHNLKHAAQGLVSHLMYAGVKDPYMVGGHHHNEPE